MKILAVLALLITLSSSAYVNWSLDSVANSSQIISPASDSPGTCTISQTYTVLTNTLKGTFTCTGLKGNVTAAHIHIVTNSASYSVATDDGSVAGDCVINVNADGVTGDFTSAFKDSTTMDAICSDLAYFNFHTDAFGSGEVRANLVSMRPLCLLGSPVTPDGKAVVPADAVAPATGIRIPDFYIGFVANKVLPGGSGGAYIVFSWDSVNQILTVSGCTYGLTSNIISINAYYTDAPSTSIYTLTSGYSFATGKPFSFRITGFSDWGFAEVISGKAYIGIQTVTLPTGEITADLISANFPSFAGKCVPYTGLTYNDKVSLSCQVGTDSTHSAFTCAAGTYCSIDDLEIKSCSSLTSCYICECGATAADLPTFGYACCDKDDCNTNSLASYSCTTTPSGSTTISVGVFISLFAVLLMKWFN